jgi:peptidyl-tRNA hydrolase
VLSNFPKKDIPLMRDAMDNALSALELMIQGDTEGAMSKYNS